MSETILRVDNFRNNLSLQPSVIDSGFSRIKSALVLFLYYFATTFINLILTFAILIINEILTLFYIIIDIEVIESLLMTLTYITTILCLIPFFIKIIGSDIKKIFKTPIKAILIILILYLGVLTITNLYYEFIEPLLINISVKLNIIDQSVVDSNLTSDNQASIEALYSHPIAMWILIPSVIFIGPLTEEMVFRKALFRIVNSKKNIINILISSLLFASIHVASGILLTAFTQILIDPKMAFQLIFLELIYSGGYFLAGLLLSTCYVLSGQNLIIVFIIHLLNNLLATLQIIM